MLTTMTIERLLRTRHVASAAYGTPWTEDDRQLADMVVQECRKSGSLAILRLGIRALAEALIILRAGNSVRMTSLGASEVQAVPTLINDTLVLHMVPVRAVSFSLRPLLSNLLIPKDLPVGVKISWEVHGEILSNWPIGQERGRHRLTALSRWQQEKGSALLCRLLTLLMKQRQLWKLEQELEFESPALASHLPPRIGTLLRYLVAQKDGAPLPPYHDARVLDLPDQLPLQAEPRRRSVLFLHHAYYNFFYLAQALRRRGWDAISVSQHDPDGPESMFFHGQDIHLYDPDPEEKRRKLVEFYFNQSVNYGMIHFHGMGCMSFFAENWFGGWNHYTFPGDLAELKRRGVKLGYTHCGCLDAVSQTSFRRWTGGMCDLCVHRDNALVCSDDSNLAWGRKIERWCDLICIETDPLIDMKLTAKTYREPLTFAVSAEMWRPDLDVPEQFLRPRRENEIIVYHGVGNFDRRTVNGRNYKGTHAIITAIEKLAAEGIPIRLDFVKNIPNIHNRFVMAQADIVIDQLMYGRTGATAREGLMLGKPVVAKVTVEEDSPQLESRCVREAPIVHADVDSITDVLRRLALSPELRRELGQQSREHAMAWWSDDACAARFETVYDRLMAGQPPGLG
ncbi:glycosyltransferase family 4 protein [Azospirillum humicireducens]|uniref:glycosyltransferase family 4 protein n=1 Tax=Azospirillum humicireducens TaxID=1226968 RepID=UPI0011B1F18B|nr:glycosyltransferase family 4 protein [Azospirillum humicireducens]